MILTLTIPKQLLPRFMDKEQLSNGSELPIYAHFQESK